MKYLIFLVSLLIIISCESKNSADSPKQEDTVKSVSSDTEKKEISKSEKESSWKYSEKEDKMTSNKILYASVIAKEKLQFDFPYNGGSEATLIIRKNDNVNDIMLRVSKGQFNNSISGGDVRIRFDELKPKKYSFLPPSDGSSDVIFLKPVKELLSKIKQSHKMIIEAEFFNEGLRHIEFDIEGLKFE